MSSDSFITVSKCCSSWFWGDDGLESDAWTRKEILYHVPSMAFWECLEYKQADEDPPLSMSSWASHHCRNLMPDTHSESLFVQHTQTFTYCSYIYMSAYQPNLIGKRNLFTWWWFRMNMHDVICWKKHENPPSTASLNITIYGACDEWGGAESHGNEARPVEWMIMNDTCATHRSRVPRRSFGRNKRRSDDIGRREDQAWILLYVLCVAVVREGLPLFCYVCLFCY